MIVFNNQEFDLEKSMTVAQLLEIMKEKDLIKNTALLVTLNSELISPSEVYKKMINDGDVIKTRYLPTGG
ncbi:hypothetical protein Q5O24_01600 [Eubacteriaceae bacterium ES3]|nr:hypothetical protein Q5O24_01600 [Eubacteriaceae bacterium ES3]